MTDLPPPPSGYGPQEYGTPGGPQRPGRRRGAIMIASAVVVALVVVLGGGFAWPGWFTDGTDAHNPGDTAGAFVEAVNSRDVDAARDLLCPSLQRSDYLGGSPESLNGKTRMKAAGKLQVDGNSATQPVTLQSGTAGGVGLNLTLAKHDGRWCVNGIMPDGAASSSTPAPSQTAAAKAMMRKLVGAINAGDTATAQSLVCPDALADTKDNVTTATTEGITISGFTVYDTAGDMVGIHYQYRKPDVTSERSGRMTLSHNNEGHNNEAGWCLHQMS